MIFRLYALSHTSYERFNYSSSKIMIIIRHDNVFVGKRQMKIMIGFRMKRMKHRAKTKLLNFSHDIIETSQIFLRFIFSS